MTHHHFIQKTLGIKDKNITFEDKITEKKINDTNHLVYYGQLTYKPKACEKCGVENHSHQDLVKNGFKTSTIKLTQIGFKPVLLKLKKQRFLCKHCGCTFTAKTQLVAKDCFISNPIKTTIAMELREEQSMTLIAKHLNISVSTVIRQLQLVGQTLQIHYHTLPEHLAMDEFKSVEEVSGSMSFLFLDAANHRLIDVVENRQQNYLFEYFMRYSWPARKGVKTVTMDMYSPYVGLAESCFPNAEIIIDRFHIVQHLNRALNKVRIDTMNDLRYTHPRDYSKLKKQWRLVLKNEWDLNHKDYYSHRLYDGLVSEYIMTNYLAERSPELLKTYILINRLKSALERRNFQAFETILMEAKKYRYPRKVRTVLQTLEKYLKSIKNSFKYTLSNGPVEGTNNKIKNIKRSGYGYRNFQNLRSRILICFCLGTEDQEAKALYFKKEEEKVS